MPLLAASAVAALIDQTLLRPEAGRGDLERLCEQARRWRFAAVCVAPSWVELCWELLAGSGVRVAAVVGFPLGSTLSEVKAHEAERVQALGASEIDMVVHLGRLRDGDLAYVRRDIEAVVAVRRPGSRVKVILETALLGERERCEGALVARDAGADFVKTSTGFGPGGATVADVAMLRQALGPAVGVKAAGGIRDLATLERLVAAGATRIGTSAGASIVEEAARARG